MNRNPTKNVRDILSKEVGFVCPVDGCDSPYLSWHHFDPPWHIKEHHNPEGMIALCKQHHGEADSGTWTNEQLKKMKAQNNKKPKGRFNWKRKQILLLAGGTYYAHVSIPLMIQNKPIVWFTEDENGNQMLNFDIYNSEGLLIFSMRDNCWDIESQIINMDCPPNAKKLKFSLLNGIKFDISFTSLDEQEFYNFLYKQTKIVESKVFKLFSKKPNIPISYLSDYENDDYIKIKTREIHDNIIPFFNGFPIVLCSLKCNLIYPYDIVFDTNSTKMLGFNMVGGFMGECNVGISC